MSQIRYRGVPIIEDIELSVNESIHQGDMSLHVLDENCKEMFLNDYTFQENDLIQYSWVKGRQKIQIFERFKLLPLIEASYLLLSLV